MINDIYVFDDIITKENQLLIYDYVRRSDIKWVELDNIRGGYGGANLQSLPAKVHPHLYVSNSEIDSLIESIQLIVSQKLNLSFVENYRYKINWTKPLNFEYEPKHLMHIDRMEQHIAMVYYINDTTGSTYIYKNKAGDTAELNKKNYVNNIDYNSLELIKQVSPKMGRVVVFNGILNHHAEYPINNDRFIINFNFVANFKNKALL